MLDTNLIHVESAAQLTEMINQNENVMVCCGRMGPMCIPVYGIMESLVDDYKNVKFCDMEFDHPEASIIRNLPECQSFYGLPFTIYYKNGKVTAATSSIQNRAQITSILDDKFGKP